MTLNLATEDFNALMLSLTVASITSILLVVICTPIAWRLSRASHVWKLPWLTLFNLPLVLPPTVVGFYLLLNFGPDGQIGKLWFKFFGTSLNFSFSGILLGSMVCSLPFVLIPLLQGFQKIPQTCLEQASMLGAKSSDLFFSYTFPTCRLAYLNAFVLSFAHTLGEFGVILMIGGNIPGVTQVVSIRIFEHVESLNLEAAHQLSLTMLFISFITIFLLYLIEVFHQKKITYKPHLGAYLN